MKKFEDTFHGKKTKNDGYTTLDINSDAEYPATNINPDNPDKNTYVSTDSNINLGTGYSDVNNTDIVNPDTIMRQVHTYLYVHIYIYIDTYFIFVYMCFYMHLFLPEHLF
jgi:hypothetical protein